MTSQAGRVSVQFGAIVEAMSRPQFYPHRPAAVTVEQTHISFVFLAGDQVYKIKKPVRFSFLDFSTLDRRRRLCHEEVRLNRRLAADIYLGVVSVCDDNGRLRLGSEDDPAAVEYAVHMRRLPHQHLLDHLLDHGDVSPAMIEQLAARLVEFHAKAACGPEITANGSADAVWRVLEDNYSNGRRFRGNTIAAGDDDAIQKFARSFLDDHAEMFRRRQEEGRIRECHGDLHSEHVCFSNGLVIFDCIEFNTQFRYIDVASDIAFLAMDLDYHGRSDLAELFVDAYVRGSGDHEARRLLPFYKCYRAYVRGKVDSLKSIEPDVPEAERVAASASARRHFELAYRYTWAYTPALVVVCGLSGTGKSALAAALAARTGFVHLNSDVVRKQLAGLPPTFRARTAYDTGLYTPELSERTYRTMLETADDHLGCGRGVDLDATFQLRRGRDEARAIAARRSLPILFVECECAPGEVERRIRQRQERADSPSDADWNVYLQQRQRYQRFEDDEVPARLVADTTDPCRSFIAQIEARLRGCG